MKAVVRRPPNLYQASLSVDLAKIPKSPLVQDAIIALYGTDMPRPVLTDAGVPLTSEDGTPVAGPAISNRAEAQALRAEELTRNGLVEIQPHLKEADARIAALSDEQLARIGALATIESNRADRNELSALNDLRNIERGALSFRTVSGIAAPDEASRQPNGDLWQRAITIVAGAQIPNETANERVAEMQTARNDYAASHALANRLEEFRTALSDAEAAGAVTPRLSDALKAVEEFPKLRPLEGQFSAPVKEGITTVSQKFAEALATTVRDQNTQPLASFIAESSALAAQMGKKAIRDTVGLAEQFSAEHSEWLGKAHAKMESLHAELIESVGGEGTKSAIFVGMAGKVTYDSLSPQDQRALNTYIKQDSPDMQELRKTLGPDAAGYADFEIFNRADEQALQTPSSVSPEKIDAIRDALGAQGIQADAVQALEVLKYARAEAGYSALYRDPSSERYTPFDNGAESASINLDEVRERISAGEQTQGTDAKSRETEPPEEDAPDLAESESEAQMEM